MNIDKLDATKPIRAFNASARTSLFDSYSTNTLVIIPQAFESANCTLRAVQIEANDYKDVQIV